MSSRRKFIATGLVGIAGINLLPAINTFAGTTDAPKQNRADKYKLRFALVSDGHYAQPNTDGDKFYTDMVNWMKKEHQEGHLDMVIVNGDLVHNRPDLLPKVKSTYLDKLPVPYYTLPGNHDYADAAIWKSAFGYEDNYTIDKGDVAFVLANTADTKGKYISADINFLKASFEKFKAKPIVFAVLHIPPKIWMPEEKEIFIDCPDVVELLHAYPNIKAVFHGHDHAQDGVRYTGKLPHLFDSHFGGNWGTAYKGYRVVEVGLDSTINTYQVNASMNPKLNATKIG